MAMEDLQETIFFLIGRRCLRGDNHACRIGLVGLLKELCAHSPLFLSLAIVNLKIRALRAAGMIEVQEEVAGASGIGKDIFSLSFEITPAGLAYIDGLCPVCQDQGEIEGVWL